MRSLAFALVVILTSQLRSEDTILTSPRTSLFLPYKATGKASWSRELLTTTFGKFDVPIILEFSPSTSRGEMLPAGWRIPLFESSAFKTSENELEVCLPNGHVLAFKKKAGEDAYDSCGKWIVRLLGSGEDRIRVSDNQTTLEYENGKLKRLEDKDFQISWKYSADGRLSEIVDDLARRPLLEAVNTSTGVVRKTILRLPGAPSQQTELDYTITPDLSPDQFKRLTGVNGDQMRSIKAPGVDVSLDMEDCADGLARMVIEDGKADPVDLIWDAEGYLKEAGGVHYNVDRSLSEKHPEISKIGADGTVDVLQQARWYSNGILSTKLAGGKIRQQYFVTTPQGSTLRKENILNEDGSLEQNEVGSSYQARFDASGKVIQDTKGAFTRKLVDGKYQVYKNGILLRTY